MQSGDAHSFFTGSGGVRSPGRSRDLLSYSMHSSGADIGMMSAPPRFTGISAAEPPFRPPFTKSGNDPLFDSSPVL